MLESTAPTVDVDGSIRDKHSRTAFTESGGDMTIDDLTWKAVASIPRPNSWGMRRTIDISTHHPHSLNMPFEPTVNVWGQAFPVDGAEPVGMGEMGGGSSFWQYGPKWGRQRPARTVGWLTSRARRTNKGLA